MLSYLIEFNQTRKESRRSRLEQMRAAADIEGAFDKGFNTCSMNSPLMSRATYRPKLVSHAQVARPKENLPKVAPGRKPSVRGLRNLALQEARQLPGGPVKKGWVRYLGSIHLQDPHAQGRQHVEAPAVCRHLSVVVAAHVLQADLLCRPGKVHLRPSPVGAVQQFIHAAPPGQGTS